MLFNIPVTRTEVLQMTLQFAERLISSDSYCYYYYNLAI